MSILDVITKSDETNPILYKLNGGNKITMPKHHKIGSKLRAGATNLPSNLYHGFEID